MTYRFARSPNGLGQKCDWPRAASRTNRSRKSFRPYSRKNIRTTESAAPRTGPTRIGIAGFTASSRSDWAAGTWMTLAGFDFEWLARGVSSLSCCSTSLIPSCTRSIHSGVLPFNALNLVAMLSV